MWCGGVAWGEMECGCVCEDESGGVWGVVHGVTWDEVVSLIWGEMRYCDMECGGVCGVWWSVWCVKCGGVKSSDVACYMV